MPITKQAIKRVKQDKKRTARNRHYSSQMKSLIKLILDYVQKGEAKKAEIMLPKAVKAIDTAAKKNLIHKNNAAHKKSRLQKAFNSLSGKKAAKKEVKAEAKEVKADAKKTDE